MRRKCSCVKPSNTFSLSFFRIFSYILVVASAFLDIGVILLPSLFLSAADVVQAMGIRPIFTNSHEGSGFGDELGWGKWGIGYKHTHRHKSVVPLRPDTPNP